MTLIEGNLSPPTSEHAKLSLDRQHAAYVNNRFLAMPIAGAIAWTGIAVAGAILPLYYAVWALFIGTGMIFYLGLAIARITGEDLLGRRRQGNFFDRVFLLSVVSALMVFAIAIPFFLIEPTSLPLSVGVLAGLMWFPFSGLARHWVGLFHGFTRTALVVTAWYAFPDDRFVAVPIVIVAVYLVTIFVLARRSQRIGLGGAGTAALMSITVVALSGCVAPDRDGEAGYSYRGWYAYGGNAGGTRYSPLEQITRENKYSSRTFASGQLARVQNAPTLHRSNLIR